MVELTHTRRDRGYALVLLLGLTSLLLPLVTFVIAAVRLDLLLYRQNRAAIDAFYAAESSLESALAEIEIGPPFEWLERGPDGQSGTNDDGQPPARILSNGVKNGFSTGLRIVMNSHEEKDIVVTASAANLPSQSVLATLNPSANPLLPSAVYFESDTHRDTNGLVLITGAPKTEIEDEIPSILIAKGDPTDADSAVFPVTDWASEIAKDRRARRIDSETPGNVGFGIHVLPADRTSLTAFQGSGVFVAEGDLELSGPFQFEGIAAIRGSLRCKATSNIEIRGGLLVGHGARTFDLEGTGSITADRTVLRDVDRRLPRALLHRSTFVGWRERE